MLCTWMITLVFLLLELSPFVFQILSPICNSNTLWNISMVFGRYAQQEGMTLHIRITTLSFLFLAFSPFLIFDSDYALISCPLCKAIITLWNIFMILGRNVEQDEMACHVQEWQLWLSYFWSHLHFLCLNLISCSLCNSNTLWIILILLGRNVEQEQTTCCVQEWQLWIAYFCSYLPFLYLNLISCQLCKLNTLYNILMILCSNIEQDEPTCGLQEWQLWLS